MGSSGPSASTSMYTSTIDPSSPLFLSSSNVPGIFLIVPFSGVGFRGWKRIMIVSLSARNKMGFIDGSCIKPTENSSQYRQWDRCNNMVILWLTHSLSPDIAESVQYSEIDERSLDIASYFNKLNKVWDELGVMYTTHANPCVCAAKEGLQRKKEEDNVHQFLMGLNEVYVGVRSNMLMMQPLPSLDSVYNILLQDEKQRQVNPNPSFQSESASFNVNSSFNKSIQPHFQQKQINPQAQEQFHQRVNFDQPRNVVFCKYCKKPAQMVENCYKFIGFPSNFKLTKGRKGASNMVENSDLPHFECVPATQPT
uniref:Retrotransposon Copia-like N-terminal domain-containing protein n=1 Tax=Nicotiana tabacum TaxID=4097 RepID=A0A1S3XXI3_TOBAC|nr:PREDICTED: uncharacterized protein LOC107769913 [Nicotiana tabacum]